MVIAIAWLIDGNGDSGGSGGGDGGDSGDGGGSITFGRKGKSDRMSLFFLLNVGKQDF